MQTVKHGDLDQLPVARVRVQVVRALPQLQLLVQDPNAVALHVVVDAVGNITDGLVLLQMELDLRLDLERGNRHVDDEACGEDDDVGMRVLDSLNEQWHKLAVLPVFVVGEQVFVLELDHLFGQVFLFVVEGLLLQWVHDLLIRDDDQPNVLLQLGLLKVRDE